MGVFRALRIHYIRDETINLLLYIWTCILYHLLRILDGEAALFEFNPA